MGKRVAQFRHPKIESIGLGGDPNAPVLPENLTLDELRDYHHGGPGAVTRGACSICRNSRSLLETLPCPHDDVG